MAPVAGAGAPPTAVLDPVATHVVVTWTAWADPVAKLLATCIDGTATACDTALAVAQRDLVPEVERGLDTLVETARHASPAAEIVVVTMPRPFGDAGAGCVGPGTVTPAFATAIDDLVAQLDERIQSHSLAHGWRTADPGPVVADHSPCSRQPWLAVRPIDRVEPDGATLPRRELRILPDGQAAVSEVVASALGAKPEAVILSSATMPPLRADAPVFPTPTSATPIPSPRG